jgi:tetratricopeptide (TPR) repeat protein
MSPDQKARSFVDRLKSARLARILVVYLAVSWGVIQALDILSQQFALPDWFFPAGIGLLAIGLPILVATAFIQTRLARADASAVARVKASGTTAWHAPRRWFTWRRAILGGVIAFASLGSVGIGLVWSRNRGHDLQPDVVAVLPFHPVGSDVALWGEGLVDLVSTALDGTGAYRASDPRAVLISWGKAIGGIDELAAPDQAARVATALGAGNMILGSVITTAPGEVRVAAELFNVRWLRKDASAAVEGPESEMTALVDQLTVELLKSIWQEGEVPEVRVSTITTSSIPALRAYLEGEQAFRRSRFTAAQQGFGRAVELDSTFAIAAHRLSFAYGWALGAFEEEHIRNAELAARHTAGLPARDSLLITGHKLVDIDGDLHAIELYENLTRRYPDDYEAWYGFGEALYHLGDQVGYGHDRVIDAMARAYAIDSTIAPSLFHLIQGTFLRDEEEASRNWTARYLAIDSTSAYAHGLRLAGALRLGPAEDSASAAEALDTLGLGVFQQMTFAVPPGRSSLAYSEQVRLASGEQRFPAAARAFALESLGRQYLRHGQIARWLEIDREADRIQGREDELYQMTMARWAGILADSASIALQEQLAARESYPETASYLATLYAQQGRFAEAQAAVDLLERAADSLVAVGDSARARSRRGFALAYQGHIAAARQDADAAIDYLRRGLDLIPGNLNDARNLHRFTLASLIESGDELEAMRVYGSLYQSAWLEALGYLRRAQLHERRNEREDALRYFGWFLELWSDADDHLQPRVESARRAMERLAGESSVD